MTSQILYYILVASDTDKNRLSKPSAFDVAKYRLARREWGMGERTRNRKAIRAGDQVLIYLSGNRELGKHFIAYATVTAPAAILSHSRRLEVDAPSQAGIVMPPYSIKLSMPQFFRLPVPISSIKSKLSFVSDPTSNRWGACLQGGCLAIAEPDFRLILNRGK